MNYLENKSGSTPPEKEKQERKMREQLSYLAATKVLKREGSKQ